MGTYLILSLHSKVYKKNPLVRIYINDACVDEFHLPHSYCDSNYTYDLLDPLQHKKNKQQHIDDINFVKIISFQSQSKVCKIKIEIINNDNNYTNGFMTKTTLVKIRYVFLIDKKELRTLANINHAYAYAQNNFGKFYPIKKYYTDKLLDNKLWENFSDIADYNFNGLKTNDANKRKTGRVWLGGSGTMQISAKKHMGLWRAYPRNLGVCRLGYVHVIEKIMNKYIKDENI